MGLGAYEREVEREVTLPRGVACCLRQYGSPFYWRSFYSRLRVEQSGLSEDQASELEYDVRAWAVAEAVVVWIEGDDGQRITDTQELYEILRDPKYWELLSDIVDEANSSDKYLSASKQHEIKKSSSVMQESTNPGEKGIADPESITLPSGFTGSGVGKLAS